MSVARRLVPFGVAATIIASGAAQAAPCTSAERGTYLSNVCWLFADFQGWRADLVAADRSKCTVQLEENWRKRVAKVANPHPDDSLHWRFEKRKTKFTIYFNRANVRASKITSQKLGPGKWLSCLVLVGEGVSDHPRYDWMRNTFKICGERERERLKRAVDNLYGRYCSGVKSEF